MTQIHANSMWFQIRLHVEFKCWSYFLEIQKRRKKNGSSTIIDYGELPAGQNDPIIVTDEI